MIFYLFTVFLISFGNHPILSYNYHGVTPIKVAGILAVGTALWEVVAGRASLKQIFSRQSARFGLFSVLFFISVLSHWSQEGMTVALRYVSVILFYVSTSILVNSKKRLLLTLITIVVSMDMASLYMFREYSLYGQKYINFRPGGIYGDPNYFALACVAVLPLTYAMYKSVGFVWQKAFFFFSAAMCMSAFVMSQSRGGMIGLGVIIIAVMLKGRIKEVIFTGIIISLFIAIFPNQIKERIGGSASGSKASVQFRTELIKSGMNMIKDKPLFGVGPGNYKSLSKIYNIDVRKPQIAHNSYLEVAAEVGMPALIIFVMMWYGALREAKKLASLFAAYDPMYKMIFFSMKLSLLGYMASAFFLSAEYEKVVWLIISLINAGKMMARQEKGSAKTAS